MPLYPAPETLLDYELLDFDARDEVDAADEADALALISDYPARP